MENAITDVTVVYEFSIEPPPTLEKLKSHGGGVVLRGPEKYTWSAVKPLTEISKSSCDYTVMNEDGNTYDVHISQSYNGKIAKQYLLDGWPTRHSGGIISNRKNFKPLMSSTPLVYTVHCFAEDDFSLPHFLREKEKVTTILDNEIKTVNDFNTISVTIYVRFESKEILARRIFFAVEHNFTPVKFEYFNGRTVSDETNVLELKEVKEGIWFPVKGYRISYFPDILKGIYNASSVVANQGLEKSRFDIEFPPGTKVEDHITGKMYTIKPTQQQVDQSLPK
jgi:hypothetical protein